VGGLAQASLDVVLEVVHTLLGACRGAGSARDTLQSAVGRRVQHHYQL
jgi:Fe-S cluster biogenesis protein NfuA